MPHRHRLPPLALARRAAPLGPACVLALGLAACAGDAPPPPREDIGPAYGARGADVPEGLRGAPEGRHDQRMTRAEPTEPRPLAPQQADAR